MTYFPLRDRTGEIDEGIVQSGKYKGMDGMDASKEADLEEEEKARQVYAALSSENPNTDK